MTEFKKENLIPGGIFIACLAVVSIIQGIIWGSAPDDCSLDSFGEEAANAWNAHDTLPNSACYQKLFRGLSDMEVSQQAARDLEAELATEHPRMGYKIGLHDPNSYSKIGLPGPMFGVIYGQDAFFDDGATVPIKGQRLNYEPDFLFKIGDVAVNNVTTPEEVVPYLSEICAFIELPLVMGDPEEIKDGFIYPYLMQATNLGSRHGVIGECMDPADDPDIFANLRNMMVLSVNTDGTVRSTYDVGEIDAVHPLIVVNQVAESLKKRGESLEEGDVISLGMMAEGIFIDLVEPMQGMRHVHYYIGENMLSVSTGFSE